MASIPCRFLVRWSCLGRQRLQARALHPPRAVSRSGSRCRALAVATESLRLGEYQADSRFSVQLASFDSELLFRFAFVQIQQSGLMEDEIHNTSRQSDC